MTEILMPKLSDTMTEGVLGGWKKNVGDQIARGDIIAEVETDKAVMELEAFASGTLLEQRVKPGATVPVGTVIGIIGEKGEAAVEPPQPEKPEPSVEQIGQQEDRPERSIPGTGKSAPIVRRQAHELGVEIGSVQGTGPGGRVLMEDVERHAASAKTQPDSSARKGESPGTGYQLTGGDETVPLNRMRKAIANIVSNSWSTIPHFGVSMKIQMDNVLALRQEFKKNNISITLNDLVLKGTALSLEKFPLLNASFSGDNTQMHHAINIGIMVSVNNGLLVPVIKECRSLSLRRIAEVSADLAERARNGNITEAELTGGTFSISNLGMFGISRFSAIILPGQVAILAVGGVMDEVILEGGAAMLSKTMEATLSADHRVLDGAYVAKFLGEFRQIMENPVRLLA